MAKSGRQTVLKLSCFLIFLNPSDNLLAILPNPPSILQALQILPIDRNISIQSKPIRLKLRQSIHDDRTVK